MNLISQNTCQSKTNQQQNPYYFNIKQNINGDDLIRSYFKSVFKHCLVSKITYKNSQTKVEMQFFYYFIDNKDTTYIEYIDPAINKKGLKNLSILLEHVYGKKVCIVINRVHYPYINAQIISEYLGIKSQSNTFINFKRSIIKNTVLQINNLCAFIVGIKIQVHGRLITERVIPRKTQKYKILGTFTMKNFNGLRKEIKVCKGQINLKNELGAFTITVELAQLMASANYLIIFPVIGIIIINTYYY